MSLRAKRSNLTIPLLPEEGLGEEGAPTPSFSPSGRGSNRRFPRGELLIIALVFTAILLTMATAFIGSQAFYAHTARTRASGEQAVALAEGGVSRTLRRLNETAGSFTGDAWTLSTGEVETTVATIDTGTREITSTGYIPNKAHMRISRTVKMRLASNPPETSVPFRYGVQVGEGGIELANNAKVKGSVYSNGPIDGADGVRVEGDLWVASSADEHSAAKEEDNDTEITFGNTTAATDAAVPFTLANPGPLSKVEVHIRKIGNPQNLTVRIVPDTNGVPSTTDVVNATLSASSVGATAAWVSIAFAVPPVLNKDRVYWLALDSQGDNASKYYGWSADDDADPAKTAKTSENWSQGKPWNGTGSTGLHRIFVGGERTQVKRVTVTSEAHAPRIESATIEGKAFATEFIASTASSTLEANLVDGATAKNDVTAVTIKNSTITGNVTCTTITGSTVGGATNCGVAVTAPEEPAPKAMPTTDADIQKWKNQAADGGTIEGNYAPAEGALVSVGPKKITGNLILTGGQTMILAGTLWVQGNVEIDNNTAIKLDPAYADKSGLIIADGYIHITNNGAFSGSGAKGSYLMFLSTLDCDGAGGSKPCAAHDAAVDLENNVDSTIVTAPRGLVYLHNNVKVRQVTAHKLHLSNNAELEYETGLADARFIVGPAGGWKVQRGSWRVAK